MNTSTKHVTPQLSILQLLKLDPTHHLPSQSVLFSDVVKVDHDNIVWENIRNQFHKVLQAHDD